MISFDIWSQIYDDYFWFSFQSITPNKYDALAEYHTGMTSVSAHGGCNFHGWHRMYILM